LTVAHAAPIRQPDPDGDKRRALRLAGTAAARADVAEQTRANAVRFAAECGASLREIAGVTGMSTMTVKRIIDRTRTAETAQ
jgi:DNA invertase Pin-like site-specific DNA recombinase